MRILKSTLLSLIILLGVSSMAKAAPLPQNQSQILHVKQGGTSTSCFAWNDACDLQTALSKTNSDDQVWVAAGTYKPTTSLETNISFQLQSGVAIYGGFPENGGNWEDRDWQSNLTTLSGELESGVHSLHVVTGRGGIDNSALLDGFTISGGSCGTSGGGGVQNLSGSSPTLTNLIISNNRCFFGGGMYNIGSSNPKLTNVTFTGNDSSMGGGMYNLGNNPILTNVTFIGNSASSGGGGVFNEGSNPIMTNVTFLGNDADARGGGLCNKGSSPVLTNVTFSGNSAQDGGGIFNYRLSSDPESNPILTNVTFSGNSARFGGGMSNKSSSPMLANVTFFGNSAITDGGGIYNYNIDPDPASLPSVTNSILWGNIPNQMTNVNTSFVSISYCDIQDGNISGNNINTNPLLSPLADNGGFSLTHSLGVGSPAIDTGNQAICTDTDQRGFQRPMDGNGDGLSICDMGAYEVEYEPRLYLPIVTK